jgi:hypothetical protein
MSDKYPGGFVTAGAPAGFSVAFDGTGDYLNIAATSAFAWGTGDLTIECWVYLTSSTADSGIWDFRNADSNQIFLRSTSTSSLQLYVNSASQYTFSITANAWNHVAVVRSSSTLVTYVNGVQVGTVANSNNFSTNSPCSIGGFYNGSGLITGYVSNLRTLKGTALYTTTFAPPTQLFPITNTSLLTCQSPTIIDNSTNALTITANGNAAPSNFTPFAGYTGFNPALGAAAGGVWTIDEAAYYQQNRLWPIYDPYFNQTTLMLHGNSTGTVDSTGTPVYQNNTFLDSSVNNFTITRNGNTTQGSFTPFSQTGWSTSFLRANTDYLGLPNGSTPLGSNDFSIEAFVYLPDRASSYAMFAGNTDRATAGGSSFTINISGSSGYLACDFWIGGGNNPINGTVAVPINVWTHLAVCRTGGTLSQFINGVRTATTTISGSINAGSSTYNPSIGSNGTGSADNFTGYISNLRLIIGSGGYNATSSAITVPTALLTATTNTKILACQNNRYVDNSANNYTITPSGSPSTQAFSPFVPAYITPTTYSNQFDGSGDNLTAPQGSSFQFPGDFTIECWIYANNSVGGASYDGIFDTRSGNVGSSNSAGISYKPDGYLNMYVGGNNVASSVLLGASRWVHVALVRSGSAVTMYQNGISVATTTTSANLSDGYCTIGGFVAAGYWNGCISNLRVIKGTAVYTAQFTPPSAPFPTDTTNQQLLTCQASALIDSNTATTAKTITATGSVKAVASPTPFPANVDTTTLNSAYSTRLIGGSAYFDGTGDYLTVASNTAFSWGSGDFSMETWFYSQTSGLLRLFDSDSAPGFLFFQNVNYTFGFYGGNSTFYESPNNSITPFAWNHLVVTGVGGTLRLFVNGVLVLYSAAGGSSTASARTCGINGTGTQPATGYMANVRLVKGGIPTLYSTTSTSVGVGVFVPPIAAFTGSEALTGGAVSLLTNFTNGAIFDNTAKINLETAGNAQISTTQSKFGGSSMYFDGTGDFLATGKAPILDGIGGDFTIEYWQYPVTGSNGQYCVLGSAVSSYTGNASSFVYVPSTNNFYSVFNTTAGPNYTGGSYLNTWTHVAWVRSGSGSNNCALYLNGVSVATSTYTGTLNLNTTNSNTYIGKNGWDASYLFTGYLDDLRITLAARYKANFTPPTSQLQDQ